MTFKPGSFSNKQIDAIANCDARLNILEGSVRAGKTIATIVALANIIVRLPKDANIMFCGKTERTLYRNIMMLMMEIFGPTRVKYSKGSGEGQIFGRRFYAVGANDERAQDKIRGITLSFAYCDEVSLYPESFFTMLLSRLSEPGARLLATTNPDSPYHWLKVNYLDREEELDLKSWHFLLEENENLDSAYVASLKQEYTGLWYKRFILGQWVLAEGAVYDMFDEDKHVREAPELKTYTDLYVSCDYGTTNPCVFLLWGVTVNNERQIIKEYYWDSKEEGRQKTDAEYLADFEQFIEDIELDGTIVDPSAASFIQALRRAGHYVIEADNAVLDGIREVSTELSQDNIYIDPSCKNTIKEFSGYVWDKKAGERGEDRPLKQSDHAMDALRYFVHTVPLDENVNYAESPMPAMGSAVPQW
jgi:PBSX family phage terminase large subunit